MKRLLKLLIAGIILATALPPLFRNIQKPLPKGNLVFEDNFDGKKLDSSKWSRCPEWERCEGMAIWQDDCSYLDGEGHLVLHAEWDEVNKRVRSGGVRTMGKFEFGTGYYEASIKFDDATGIWGAFWMMCGNVGREDNPRGEKAVEIDIVESIEANLGKSNHALHWDGYGKKHKSAGYTNYKKIYDGNFHTFGLERTADAYIFYIDGKETTRYTSDEMGICTEDGYMKLTVEAADWAGAGKKASINDLPSDMLVDYVRVYRERPTE